MPVRDKRVKEREEEHMTSREKEIISAVEDLGGEAHPTKIGRELGISSDYAEQICRDLVWMGALVKNGLRFKLVK